MSKMDNLRAMREARYEQARARGGSAAATPTPRAATAIRTTLPAKAPEAAAPVEPDERETSEALCGHRNMGGRTCTREAGHAARSHRYS
jgi:hypothetical protein